MRKFYVTHRLLDLNANLHLFQDLRERNRDIHLIPCSQYELVELVYNIAYMPPGWESGT